MIKYDLERIKPVGISNDRSLNAMEINKEMQQLTETATQEDNLGFLSF